MYKKSQKGTSLYFAILVMGILLAAGLGVSTILVMQTRMIKGVGDSVQAFYAADTGIERALYDLYVNGISPEDIVYNNESIGDAQYSVQGFTAPSLDCPAPYTLFCIQSRGTYKSTRRAIEVGY